jgi:hypothetical protein
MGKPVDATPGHVQELREKKPALFEPFDAEKVAAELEKMVGPISIRSADDAGPGTTERTIKLMFFPQREGLDSTYFSKLTHPGVELRGMGSALDVFAVLAEGRAKKHALEIARAEDYADDYRKVLDKLIAEQRARDEAYFSTDVYHSWLAVLVTLASPVELSEESLLAFAKTDAFKDRQLQSALAGYTQLKHSAVLYAAQDNAAECDSTTAAIVLIEQPVLPMPRGFVDPTPVFFERLSKLAKRVYADLWDKEEPPAVYGWDSYGSSPETLNAATFASDLAAIARKEVAGEALSQEDYFLIRGIGERLEALTLQLTPMGEPMPGGGDKQRAKRGIAIATDIQTNQMRGQVRQIAIGRIDDMWVVVPDDVGHRMTQGGIMSFYEFLHPASDRLTDTKWNARIEAGKLPDRPAFTESFLQNVTVDWSE